MTLPSTPRPRLAEHTVLAAANDSLEAVVDLAPGESVIKCRFQSKGAKIFILLQLFLARLDKDQHLMTDSPGARPNGDPRYDLFPDKVRKMPSWPRCWANSSLL